MSFRQILMCLIALYCGAKTNCLYAQFAVEGLSHRSSEVMITRVYDKNVTGIMFVQGKEPLASNFNPDSVRSKDAQAVFFRYSYDTDGQGRFTHVILANGKTYQIKKNSLSKWKLGGMLEITYDASTDALTALDQSGDNNPIGFFHAMQPVVNIAGAKGAALLNIASGFPEGLIITITNTALMVNNQIIEEPIIGNSFDRENPCEVSGAVAFPKDQVDEYIKTGKPAAAMLPVLRQLQRGENQNYLEHYNLTKVGISADGILVLDRYGRLSIVRQVQEKKLDDRELCQFYGIL